MKFIFTPLLLISFACLAQDDFNSEHYIDSLKNVLLNDIDDTSRAYALKDIADEYSYLENDSAILYFEQCINFCDYVLSKGVDKYNLSLTKSVALSDLGYHISKNGDLKLGLDYYYQSIKCDSISNNLKNNGSTLDNIGVNLYQLGQIEESILYAKRALKVREKNGDKKGVAISLNNLGYIFHMYTGDKKKGLEYYERSYEILKQEKDKEGQSHLLNNIGYINFELKNYQRAIVEFNEAVKIAESIGDKSLSISPLINLAELYDDLGMVDTSKHINNYIIKLSKEIGSKYNQLHASQNLAWIYYNENELDEAISFALKILSSAKEYGFRSVEKNMNNLLYKAYDDMGNKSLAYDYFKEFISIRDTLNNKKSIDKAINTKYQYEYEKQKAVDDAENEKLVEIEKQEKEKQQIYTYAGLAGIFLMLVVSGLILRGYRQKKQANVLIAEQKNEVEIQRDSATIQKLIVEEKNKEILESITYAKRIQEAILPPPRLVKEWLTESFIFYKPKDIVAGDFYWMETATHKIEGKEKTLVYFAAADCTGHGVPGAMVSVVCANALNKALKEFSLIEPGKVLDKVTEIVIESFEKSEEEIKDGMDIALCALDISAKKIYYSGANNPLYRITSINTKLAPQTNAYANDTHQLIAYKATKQPVGYYENKKAFDTIEIHLEPGDAIYIFSDGFADQFGGEKGKKYKYSSFRQCLLENFSKPMETQKQLLEHEFNNWKGELEQVDDVCVIGVKINGVEKRNFTKRELEVLAYLQDGLPSKLIADKMNISKHTVDTHRRRLLAKTGTFNATELINYCIKKEII